MTRTFTSDKHGRYPLATVVLMGVAIALILLLLLGSTLLPYLPVSFLQYGAFLPLVPPLLFFVGALVSAFDQSASTGAKVGWGAASAVCAFLSVGVTWRLGVLIFGP